MIGTLRLVLTIIAAILSLAVLLPVYFVARAVNGAMSIRIARLWHAFILSVMGVRVVVHGGVSNERPLLLLANHISWLDIIVLAGTLPVSFIAKKEVGTWPVFGWLARLQRSIFVDRERRRQTIAASDHVASRMADGEIIVLFAEGTSSDGNRVLPFRSALVGAAQRAVDGDQAALLQPVAIAYTRLHGLPIDRRQRARIAWYGDMDLMPHLHRILSDGGLDVHLVFAAPIGLGRDGNRKTVAKAAGDRVARLVSELNSGLYAGSESG